MPVYRLSSNKHHICFFTTKHTDFRVNGGFQTDICSSDARQDRKGTSNRHDKTTAVCYFIWRQNLNLKTSKTSTVEPKKLLTEEPKTGNNNKPTAEVRKKILFSPVTFSKINELRKCDQKKKHWCFFRVAYFWTTWPTLFNCRFKHSQTLNEAAELSVYTNHFGHFFFFQ